MLRIREKDQRTRSEEANFRREISEAVFSKAIFSEAISSEEVHPDITGIKNPFRGCNFRREASEAVIVEFRGIGEGETRALSSCGGTG